MGLDESGYASAVDDHYGDVYRFALSLACNEAEAADLVQEAFWKLAGHWRKLRDPRKAKGWLFTTVHREFIGRRRRAARFPHEDLDSAEFDLPVVHPEVTEAIDGRTVLDALSRVDEVFRAPLALFYLEDFSYAEIAESLEVPVGTVMSRLARGKAQLKRLLATPAQGRPAARILPFPRQAA